MPDLLNKVSVVAVAAAAIGVLAACGGGDSDGGALCDYITGGGTTVSGGPSPGCATCSASDLSNAIDGNARSVAVLQMPSGASGSLILRATAQDGVVFPAGSNAGAAFQLNFGASTSTVATLTTYMDGVMQESEQAGAINGVGSTTNDSIFVRSFRTSLSFDAVEYQFSRSGGTGEVDLRMAEFCSDG